MNCKKVAIIIVNWNGIRFLKDCFNAVYSQNYKNFDVYFVDNGSDDLSVDFVKNNFFKTKIISLKKNTGFAIGNNIGIKEAFKDTEVSYIVCLNNDTIVYNNWLEELIKTANNDENIGSVSSKAYFSDKTTINNAGLEFYKVLQANKKGGISIGFGLTDAEIPELSNDIEIFAPGGVAPLFKREVLELILKRDKEIFDEDFFAYVEDYDLGFRMNDLGYKSFLSANAKLIHLHSKTGGVASPFKSYYCERNAILTAIKNLPLIDLLLFPFRNICLKLSYLLKTNESVEKLNRNLGVWKMMLILIKANFVAIYLLPKFLIKRWEVKQIVSKKRVDKKSGIKLPVGIITDENETGGTFVLTKKLSATSSGLLISLSSKSINLVDNCQKLKVYKIFRKRMFLSLRSLLKINKQISLWHIHYPTPILLPIFLLSRKPKIITFHYIFKKSPFLLNSDGWLGGMLDKFAFIPVNIIFLNFFLLYSHGFTFLTQAQSSDFRKVVLFRRLFDKKSVVISNFIEPEFIKLVAPNKINPLNILFVGRYTKIKGFADLLKFASLMTNARFSLIGGDLKDNDLTNIVNLGKINNSEIVKYYDQNSIFILPSYSEVFPITILEAMARGLIILASNVPGMREIIKEGRNGYLFKVGDLDDLNDKYANILSDPIKLAKISENNLSDVWGFCADKQVAKYLALYKKILI